MIWSVWLNLLDVAMEINLHAIFFYREIRKEIIILFNMPKIE